MRVLEHRRHSWRDPGAVHLNPFGRELARRVAPTVGPFDRSVSSPAERAVETATELGWPPDAQPQFLREIPDEVVEPTRRQVPESFAGFLDRMDELPSVRRFAQESADRWGALLEGLPEGGRLLIVSHGGIIELGACAALGSAVRSWGAALAPLDGVRLVHNHGSWSSGEVVRALDAAATGSGPLGSRDAG